MSYTNEHTSIPVTRMTRSIDIPSFFFNIPPQFIAVDNEIYCAKEFIP